MNRPQLPTTNYIAGRAATVHDVDRGDAVFCQQSEGEAGEPFDTGVPQYAIWHSEDARDVPAILVQAERHITDPDGDALFGLRTIDGREVVAVGGEVTLLGAEEPAA